MKWKVWEKLRMTHLGVWMMYFWYFPLNIPIGNEALGFGGWIWFLEIPNIWGQDSFSQPQSHLRSEFVYGCSKEIFLIKISTMFTLRLCEPGSYKAGTSYHAVLRSKCRRRTWGPLRHDCQNYVPYYSWFLNPGRDGRLRNLLQGTWCLC